MRREVLVVGTGNMALEYCRVLNGALKRPFVVTGRSIEKAEALARQFQSPSLRLADLNSKNVDRFSFAIIATAIESLEDVTLSLIGAGIRSVLLEKPGVLDSGTCLRLNQKAEAAGALVRVAFNRRFYQSVLALSQRLATEPPVGAHFDFTEWAWQIAEGSNPAEVKRRWAIANSIHVFDTVAHLLGPFDDIRALRSGAGDLDWHPQASTFAGSCLCGKTPVSYGASWIAPGRWDVQVMTREGRYKLSPMEKLQVLRPRTVVWEELPADDSIDEEFKPGLARMVEAFAAGVEAGEAGMFKKLPTLAENARLLQSIEKVVGYGS